MDAGKFGLIVGDFFDEFTFANDDASVVVEYNEWSYERTWVVIW